MLINNHFKYECFLFALAYIQNDKLILIISYKSINLKASHKLSRLIFQIIKLKIKEKERNENIDQGLVLTCTSCTLATWKSRR